MMWLLVGGLLFCEGFGLVDDLFWVWWCICVDF